MHKVYIIISLGVGKYEAGAKALSDNAAWQLCCCTIDTMDHDAATNFGGYRRSQPQRKVVLCMCMSPFTLILGVIIAVR